MQWYWILLIVLCGGYILYSVVVSLVVLGTTTRPKRPTQQQIDRQNKEIFGFDDTSYRALPKEQFSVVSHGVEIKGEIVFNGQNNSQVAVISHGFLANRTAVSRYAEIYFGLGYNVVTYDQRYFGESGGKICTMGYLESDDLAEVVNHIKTRFPDPRFVLHGESMGAASVLLALSKIDNVVYAVADCSFSNAAELYRYLTRRASFPPVSFPACDLAFLWTKVMYGFLPRQISPIDAVKASKTPILFIHGRADNYVPAWMSQKMFEVSSNPGNELFIAEGAKHARSYTANPQAYKKKIRSFDARVSGKMI